MNKKWILPVIALALVGWSVWNVVGSQQETGKPRVSAAPPSKSPYGNGVAGAGMVEPKTEASGTALVAVNTELPGIVTEVNVHIHQKVKVGDVLFKLDDRALRALLAMKVANLDMAQKQLAKLLQGTRPEELPPLEAKVAGARAALKGTEDLLMRAENAGKATSVQDLVQARQAREVARENLHGAETKLALAKAGDVAPDIDIAKAAVAQAKAAVDQVQTDVDPLTVRAMMAGEVLELNVRVNETVTPQAGKALVMLGDTSTLHVRVQIDESDIGRFNPKAEAVALTRGVNQHKVPLRFVRVEPHVVPKISLTGDNTERIDTRVLQVIYAVEHGGTAPLVVGEQLDVFVKAGDEA